MLISLLLTLAGLGGEEPSKTHAFRPKDCPYQAIFPDAYDQQPESAGNEAELLNGNLRLSALCLPRGDENVSSGDAAARLQALAAGMGAAGMVITSIPPTDCAEARGTVGPEKAYILVARMCLGIGYAFLAEAVFPANGEPSQARTFLDGVTPQTLPKN